MITASKKSSSKRYKPLFLVLFLFVILFSLKFVSGFIFLNNNISAKNELLKNSYIEDFEVVIFHKVWPLDVLLSSSGWDRDIEGKRIKDYSFFVRTFTAWKYPEGSVSEDENWIVFGFIDMDKRICIHSKRLESDRRDYI